MTISSECRVSYPVDAKAAYGDLCIEETAIKGFSFSWKDFGLCLGVDGATHAVPDFHL